MVRVKVVVDNVFPMLWNKGEQILIQKKIESLFERNILP